MTSILNELMIAWVMTTLAEAAGSWRRYRCNDVTKTSLVVMTSQVAMTSLVVMTSSVAMP